MKHVDMRKLPAAAQEERRRQVVGLRQSGLTHAAIAARVGLTQTGAFDICKRFAERGAAGLKSGPRGPAPGTGRYLDAAQEAELRDLIRRHTPDELGLPFALWGRAAVRELVWRRCRVRLAVWTMGTYLARWGFTAQKPLRRAYEQDPAACGTRRRPRHAGARADRGGWRAASRSRTARAGRAWCGRSPRPTTAAGSRPRGGRAPRGR